MNQLENYKSLAGGVNWYKHLINFFAVFMKLNVHIFSDSEINLLMYNLESCYSKCELNPETLELLGTLLEIILAGISDLLQQHLNFNRINQFSQNQ